MIHLSWTFRVGEVVLSCCVENTDPILAMRTVFEVLQVRHLMHEDFASLGVPAAEEQQ